MTVYRRRGPDWTDAVILLAMAATLAIGFLVMGCAGSTAPLPYQAEYVNRVWHEAYGMTRDAPEVEWIASDGWGPNGAYDGITWAGWKVQVACGATCDTNIEDTSLAHELMHMRTFDKTGDVDAFHSRADWDWEMQIEADVWREFEAMRINLRHTKVEALK